MNGTIKPITFEDLRCHFRTERSYVISGTGRDRKMGYRTGIQTNAGDIDISEWKMLMENLIRRSGEEILYKLLLEWVSNNMPWQHTKQERDLEALVLHAMRIFENPEWVGYEVFRSNVARLRDQYPAGFDKEACP